MIPRIQFTHDSASAIECASWLGRNIVQGNLVGEASADIPGTILVISKVAHSISLQLAGEKLFGSEAESAGEAYAQLSSALGITQGFGGPIVDLALRQLLAALLRLLESQFSASELAESAGCDDECTDECTDGPVPEEPSVEE